MHSMQERGSGPPGPTLSLTSSLAIVLFVIAAVLLMLIAGAQAGIIAISRGRVRASQNGAHALLESYIRQRHAILGALSLGQSTLMVIATASLLVALREGRGLTVGVAVLVGLAVALLAAFLQQTARAVAMQSPEGAGLRLARPTRWLQALFTPLAWVAVLPARLALRALGRTLDPDLPDPAEELLAVLETPANDEEGTLVEERRMMRGILEMSDQTVRELMSPRMDITAVSTEASIGDVLKVVTESGFSRIPLYDESIDHIIGVVYAKDLLAYLLTGEMRPELKDIARAPYFVPETKRANELLADLRRDQVHMAIAVDEYGGTAGVVTVEDLLEEIVGEITDEYDTEEVDVQRLAEGEVIVDARLPLDDLNELFDIQVEGEDFDTVGGLVFSRLGRLAIPGDEVADEEHGLQMRVLSVVGRRIKKVRIETLEVGEREPARTD